VPAGRDRDAAAQGATLGRRSRSARGEAWIRENGMIVIGLGSGRCGTASLAKLLNAQHGAAVFHEMSPSNVRFSGTPRPILNAIEEFQAILDGGDPSMLTVDLSRDVSVRRYEQISGMQSFSMIGDIAFYYLTYVDMIASRFPNVRFICLKREKKATVRSWMQKSSLGYWRSKYIGERISAALTREPFTDSRNFWMLHDGTKWRLDPVWDKCFPKFPGPTKKEAIEQYWDYYYKEAEVLAARHPDVFRIVASDDVDDRQCQVRLLEFCGVDRGQHVYTDARIHRLAS